MAWNYVFRLIFKLKLNVKIVKCYTTGLTILVRRISTFRPVRPER